MQYSFNKLLFYVLVFLILFFAWQFYVMAKYNFGFPMVYIDNNKDLITVGKESYKYSDIKVIRILSDEKQPSILEQALSKSAFGRYMYRIELYLNNGTLVPIRCISQFVINKIKTDVAPKVNVVDETDFNKTIRIKALLISIGILISIAVILIFNNFIFRH